MALGIDIYRRYQTVTDWPAVKRRGVVFVYVKGTDGGGPAQARADEQVKGAKAVGLPVGLYHYAQFSPSPEAQANVLTAEVRRLGATGLPPALDLEAPFTPGATAREFARHFLLQLRANGFAEVVLYANTSMLAGLGADTLNIPGLRVWAANYGPNNGQRNTLSYRGRVDIHQYTSVGRVSGITGSVDLNESLTDLLGGGDDDMTPEQAKMLDDIAYKTHQVWEALGQSYAQNGGQWFGHMVALLGRYLPAGRAKNPEDAITRGGGLAEVLTAMVGAIEKARADIAEIKARPAADVDEAALAAELEQRGIGGATAEQVKEAVRAAFARAGQPEEGTG